VPITLLIHVIDNPSLLPLALLRSPCALSD